ncbi:hypothetical protein Ancab_033570, partial [Ancistrocladus abbreviatus]
FGFKSASWHFTRQVERSKTFRNQRTFSGGSFQVDFGCLLDMSIVQTLFTALFL